MEKFGIDISHWQGNINISQAKSERGVEFVIIKLGGADAGKYKDSKFDNYYNQCKSIGMPCGAYFYGNAKTVEEAQSEADYFISLLAGKQFEYPVYYDVEGKMLDNDKTTLTDIVIAFCDKVEKAGYFSGIYTSDSHFKSKVDDSKLQRFTHWVAKYSSNKPTTSHDMWQFGGGTNYLQNKTICGITVDQDYCYRDFETEIKNSGLNGFSKTSTSIPEQSKKSNEEIANEVISGLWGTGEDRKNRLTESGYDYSEVQSIVNKLCSESNTTTTTITYTVSAGDSLSKIGSKYGVKWQDIAVLNKIGSPYTIYVGQKLQIPTSGNTTTTTLKSVEEIAKEVINGKWGNGTARKESLEKAGYNYSEVQAMVNKLL